MNYTTKRRGIASHGNSVPFCGIAAIDFSDTSESSIHASGDVAGHCRVSLRLLELRFKAILNHGVRDEIENVRLENVKQMLRETGLSIKEIGYHCGFPSPAGLCTVFKRKFGKSPQVWRTDEHLNRKALTSSSIKRVSDFTRPIASCKTSYSTL